MYVTRTLTSAHVDLRQCTGSYLGLEVSPYGVMYYKLDSASRNGFNDPEAVGHDGGQWAEHLRHGARVAGIRSTGDPSASIQGPEKSTWRSDTYETPDVGGGKSQMLLSSSLVTVTAAYAHSYIKAR